MGIIETLFRVVLFCGSVFAVGALFFFVIDYMVKLFNENEHDIPSWRIAYKYSSLIWLPMLASIWEAVL